MKVFLEGNTTSRGVKFTHVEPEKWKLEVLSKRSKMRNKPYRTITLTILAPCIKVVSTLGSKFQQHYHSSICKPTIAFAYGYTNS